MGDGRTTTLRPFANREPRTCDWSSLRRRASCLRNRSIGQLLKRTQRMNFDDSGVTVMLQDDGLSDAPSVAVKKLDRPALNGSLAWVGRDFPSRRGGVYVVAATGLAQQDPDRSAMLRRELQPPRFDARNSF